MICRLNGPTIPLVSILDKLTTVDKKSFTMRLLSEHVHGFCEIEFSIVLRQNAFFEFPVTTPSYLSEKLSFLRKNRKFDNEGTKAVYNEKRKI